MCTEILRELLKVQGSIVVGVPVLDNLQPDDEALSVAVVAPTGGDPTHIYVPVSLKNEQKHKIK